MTATHTPRHDGSTGRQRLALLCAKSYISRLLAIPLYRSVYIYITNREPRFADGAGTRPKTVPTDDGGQILAI